VYEYLNKLMNQVKAAVTDGFIYIYKLILWKLIGLDKRHSTY